VRRVGPRLDLSTYVGRCKYLLGIGYAYQLIKKMIDSIPEVPSHHAMFTVDIIRDRKIYFFPNRVKKSIKNFDWFCTELMTRLDVILRAYKAGERCPSLPQLMGKRSDDYISRTGTYTVEISPLGHAPILTSKQSIRMMAKNVCEALSVLHEAGLVHRDVRLPNVVQVSQEQFMLIDLETVAASPFRLLKGFQYLRGWNIEMLEGSFYTPMLDMYQLGRLLEKDVRWMTEISKSTLQFIKKLRSKKCTTLMALSDPWLSDPIL
jgi:serine/threonine protein kinase